MTKIRIVTHSGGFHADDVFGVATLQLLLAGNEIEVIRTRDPEIIRSGDYVLDVGFVYDESKNRFDHHQEGKAGRRENEIPYASFGLIWKKFGVNIVGSKELAQRVDERLVQPIDAYDNGFPLFTPVHPTAIPFLIQDVLGFFEPAWKESKTHDEAFLEAVAFAQKIIQRCIVFGQEELDVENKVHEIYDRSVNKKLIVFEEGFIIDRVLVALMLGKRAEPLFFVRQHENKTWQVVSVVNPPLFYDNRKLLPKSWAGKRDDELAKITGVPDAFFCHDERFMAVTKTKEGAIKLAELALSA